MQPLIGTCDFLSPNFPQRSTYYAIVLYTFRTSQLVARWFTSHKAKVLPSVSSQIAKYPIPGTAVLDLHTVPPSFVTLAVALSTDATLT